MSTKTMIGAAYLASAVAGAVAAGAITTTAAHAQEKEKCYGVAMAEREPLLFKGDDFSRTDVAAVPY